MDALNEPLPDDAIKIILDRLEDDARAEFVEGIDKRIHQLSIDQSPENARAVLLWVQEWAISVIMTSSPTWRSDVQDTARRVALGSLGDPAGREELREAIAQRG